MVAENQAGGYMPLDPDDEDNTYRDIAPDDPSADEQAGYLGVDPVGEYE